MVIEEVCPSLWRWTTQHPEWTPDQGGAEGWQRDVASVAYAGDDWFVLVDPMAEDERAWTELDRLAGAHGKPVLVIATCGWHTRACEGAVGRYVNSLGAQARMHEIAALHAAAQTGWKLPAEWRFRGDLKLAGGIEAIETDPAQGEVTLWLEAIGAVVAGDVLLGAEGERSAPLSVCPQAWLADGTSRQDVSARLQRFTQLPVELVVPLHGAPVLDGAAAALRDALGEPTPGST